MPNKGRLRNLALVFAVLGIATLIGRLNGWLVVLPIILFGVATALAIASALRRAP